MKLELKHLAGYLPYALECRDLADETDFQLDVLNIDGVLSDAMYLNTIKLYLRPLSDLTKEIEVNGEKVTPIDYIKQYYLNCSIDENGVVKDDLDEYGLLYLPYLLIEKLLEWHFDIYGLIENNLAIDKNTIL